MKSRLLLHGLLIAALFASVLGAAPVAGRYLATRDFDATKVIPPAPAEDSLAALADLVTVRQVQARRTPEQVALANYFAQASIFQYASVIGPWFNAANLPHTAELFAQVDADRFAISSAGKAVWNRPRPPLVDPDIQACAPLPKSGSYPSGHTTQAFLWASLLAEIFPEKRDALRERAGLVAWSRIIAGVHYPTDIAAGRLLGDRLAAEFLKVPALREALAVVRAEVAPFVAKPDVAADSH